MNFRELDDYIGLLSTGDSVKLGSANLLLQTIEHMKYPQYRQIFFPIRAYTYTPQDLPTSAHFVHGEVFELCYVMRGQVRYTVEGNEITVRDNSLLIVGRSVVHVVESMSTDARTVFFSIGDQLLRTPFIHMIDRLPDLREVFRGNVPWIMHSFGEDILADFYGKQMCCAFFEPDSYSDLTLQLLMLLFLSQIQRVNQSTPKRSPNGIDGDINRIARYVQMHYRTVTSEEVARRFGYTENYISRALKAHFGMGFVKFRNHQCLQAASALLLTSELTLSQIAERVGLSSASHLHRLFTQAYQMTPQQYRERPEAFVDGKVPYEFKTET